MAVQHKHFVNGPETLVLDSLRGLCLLNPLLALDRQNKIVYATQRNQQHVALICGGGSGHEPSHAGFVGAGMLTAAVCGNVFASPNASQVRRALEIVDNEQGTLIIVKNYTGDVLNFGLAKEQYAALHPDKADRVKFVIVGDDVAVGRTQGEIVGRRGLAGTVLVYKIAGALARRGYSLDQVHSLAQYASLNLVTIGVGLEHTHVPGAAPGTSHLRADEIEIGMGIHNEAGAKRVSPVPPLHELVAQLVEMLVGEDPERGFVKFEGGAEVVLMVNNLGGLSELEMGGIVSEVHAVVEARGFVVKRVLAGSFMTSLNMPGFSITLLLQPANDAALILSALDDAPDVPGWKWASGSAPIPPTEVSTPAPTASAPSTHAKLAAPDREAFTAAIAAACHALVAAEPEITRMDSIAGDGDCGLTLAAGAAGVLRAIASGAVSGDDVVGSVIALARVAEEEMGGTSGALYSIFFSALAQALRTAEWGPALGSALERLYTYTRARSGARTLVDPLAAFVGDVSAAGVRAAAEAAEATRGMEARAGRSAYVEGARLQEEQVPDPGAWGVKVILEALFAQ